MGVPYNANHDKLMIYPLIIMIIMINQRFFGGTWFSHQPKQKCLKPWKSGRAISSHRSKRACRRLDLHHVSEALQDSALGKMAVCQNPGTPVVHIKIAGIYGCE